MPRKKVPQPKDAKKKASPALSEQAFGAEVELHLKPLRSFIYRMVTHPQDTDDILQEVLERAYRNIGTFRQESSFKTWLFSIASRSCIDHLRGKKRWAVNAQLDGERFSKSTEVELAPINTTLNSADFVFEYKEHVAFCFSCIGRSLPPEQQAAILLKEVFGFSNDEAARVLGISESVFRHRLDPARKSMETAFEGLCALVNKAGACYQCKVLQDASRSGGHGEMVKPIYQGGTPHQQFNERVDIVKNVDLENGSSHKLHEILFELLSKISDSK
jgi:RNA polymerase sigma-70 factor (ECF subfamily)